jgi:hypothetical protein
VVFVEEKITTEELTKALLRSVEDLVGYGSMMHRSCEWFSFEEGFWLWITERVMKQDFKKLAPYGLAYAFNIWRGLNEDERRRFKEQYKNERKVWFEKNHIKMKTQYNDEELLETP